MKSRIALLTVILMIANMLFVFPSSADEVNAAPTVIPAVREWKGGVGHFTLEKGMKVVLAESGVISDAQKNIIKEYFADICGFDVDIAVGKAMAGDIFLSLTENEKLGSEGYTAVIGDTAVIKANTSKGLLYGVITMLQSQYADGYVPVGEIVDYPTYPVRSGMIDVARAYFPLDYVEEITKYFAWFKLNEIHLHINDVASGGVGYFRLESDVPGLTAEDHYSKDEYRAYQKRMLEYGVEVITEIDTPAHSMAFAKAVPELMYDGKHLDISKPETLEFICDLFDEYITGDDPVFVSKKVHFGTDEYPEGHNEEMRAYTDALIKHINSRSYTPRFWGSFGNDGFNGKTPVSSDAECNFWAVSLSDYNTLFKMGYDVINTCGPVLYCVPGGNYGFVDYYNLETMYKSWFVNYMGYDSSTSVRYDNPQLKGASFALWNDLFGSGDGFSVFDIFDRIKYQVCLISEKTWCGEQTRKISADDFVGRFDVLSVKAGGTNPARNAEFPIDESNISSYKSVGFPYTFSADITYKGGNADILDGKDGKVYINSAGRLCLKREKYVFTFDHIFKKGTDCNIRLEATKTRTLLIVDNKWFYDTTQTTKYSSSFVLPLEKIGSEGCEVKNIRITASDFVPGDHMNNGNVALGKKVTVSGLEVDYGLNEPLAVDGNISTRLSFARDKDEQWMTVDLGSVIDIGKITIHFFERTPAYEVYVSEDGENYTKIYEASGLPEGVRGEHDDIVFDPVKARYVKYVQLKRWFCKDYNTYYSAGISEFEVYSVTIRRDDLIAEAESIDDENVKKALRAISIYEKKDKVYREHLNALYEELENAIELFKNPPAEESLPEISEEADADVSAESAAVSEESKTSDSSGKGIAIGSAAAGAALVGAAAAIIVKKKKEKK